MKAWVLLVGLAMALTGCFTVRADEADGAAHAPEEAVYEWMSQQPPDVANTMAIRQVVELRDDCAAVLVSFRPDGWDYALPALALFIVDKQDDRWVAKAYDYSSRPELSDDILTAYSPPWPDADLSAVYGLVVDERATSIGITWDDGLEQQVEVVNGSYLSVRSDVSAMRGATVAAYDTEGTTLTQSNQ